MRMLAISGSLRAASSNTSLLKAAADHAPDGILVDLFARLEEIPAFNPDRESEPAPDAVTALRAAVAAAGAVLFSTPEYAHGVPGVLKNALDWLVGSGELYEKPVALLHVSARGTFAQASLKETLVTMGARCVFDATADQTRPAALAEVLSAVAIATARGPD